MYKNNDETLIGMLYLKRNGLPTGIPTNQSSQNGNISENKF